MYNCDEEIFTICSCHMQVAFSLSRRMLMHGREVVAPKRLQEGVEPWPAAFPGVALPSLPRWPAGAPPGA